MIIYPAIDVRGGQVVRLVQGNPDQQTSYSDDPMSVARRWKTEGAEWLHVVNLDGALSESAAGPERLSRLAALGVPIQFGGGLRSLGEAARALQAGASRVILGTLVVQRPEAAGEAVQRFGAEAIAVALDARDGLVATRGWQSESRWTPIDLGRVVAGMGVKYALYTEVNRDGMLTGAAVEATARLAAETGLRVIASGGVASLEDVRALTTVWPPLAGVVIGKALYVGSVALADAIGIGGASEERQRQDAG